MEDEAVDECLLGATPDKVPAKDPALRTITLPGDDVIKEEAPWGSRFYFSTFVCPVRF